ncbi:DNA-invertase hin [Peptoniphilus indolicus]|uniref:Resolvase family site-specific recombinase n=3 Tax=Peptoniphilus TaxID=162289 RepID=G4D195_9FIRM|nr:recombinase family protein [Peptoniphilus indolicus]EGY80706.1 resolvase family site-specific recombinase [Peptoniphilus indolicus ATCC 29427]SUB74875.1 DNA-invertase hin [Peptoniphilus indolicus]
MDNTPASKLIRQIFFAFAEFERDLIVERTQEGRAIAKLKSDYREGRPKKFSQKQINHALELKKSYSYKQVSEMTGISVSTLKRANRK